MTILLASCKALIVASLALAPGASEDPPSTEELISNTIKGGMSVREQVLKSNRGIFSDYKVYRDGKKDGVVFEYVYSDEAVVDRSKLKPKLLRKELLKQFATNKATKELLDSGIYLRFVYRAADGEVISEASIVAKDLEDAPSSADAPGTSEVPLNKEEAISGAVEGGMSVRAQILKADRAIYSDYKVYRDGRKDGVVFEYVYSTEAVVDRSKLKTAALKKQLLKHLAPSKETKELLDLGIYYRYVYKAADGEVIGEAKIVAKDLEAPQESSGPEDLEVPAPPAPK